VLAFLAHPASVLLVGGLGIWIMRTYVKREQLTHLWSQRKVRWGVLLVLALGGFAAVRLLRLLRGWISEHDTGRTTSEFLLHLPGKQGLKQIVFLFGYVDSLTLPLVLTGALGILWLWRRHDRPLAILFTCMLIFPVAFLVLLSLRTPVSVFYLVPTIPLFFLGAGVFLDRILEVQSDLGPRWLLPASLVLIIVASGVPTLLSQYRDGRRYDFRSASLWLEQRLSPGDVVYSDQFKVVTHYLPKTDVQRLSVDTNRLKESLTTQSYSARQGAIWIIAPAPAHAFRTNPRASGLRQWIYNHCQLVHTVGVGRVDFRQYYLQLYRCPRSASLTAAAHSE
jgi:hypothetical protein